MQIYLQVIVHKKKNFLQKILERVNVYLVRSDIYIRIQRCMVNSNFVKCKRIGKLT